MRGYDQGRIQDLGDGEVQAMVTWLSEYFYAYTRILFYVGHRNFIYAVSFTKKRLGAIKWGVRADATRGRGGNL